MKRALIAGWLLVGLLSPGLLWAEGNVVGSQCPITWIASTSPNLKEYHLLVTRTKGVYDKLRPAAVVPVPTTQSTCQALNLTADGQHYLVMTAISLSGAESGFSAEVAFFRDTTVPLPPTGVSVGP
jgi:hypothetical protein